MLKIGYLWIVVQVLLFSTVYNAEKRDKQFKKCFNMERSKGLFVRENLKK